MFDNNPNIVLMTIEAIREKLGEWAVGKTDSQVTDKAYNLRNKVADKWAVKVESPGTYDLRDETGKVIESVKIEDAGILLGVEGELKPRRQRTGGSQENPFDF